MIRHIAVKEEYKKSTYDEKTFEVRVHSIPLWIIKHTQLLRKNIFKKQSTYDEKTS